MLRGVDVAGVRKLGEGEGLIYFNARYYDPRTGRFLTEDPSRQGVNWYAYCGNNPANLTDPSGRDVYAPGKSEPAPYSFPMQTGAVSAEYGRQQQIDPRMNPIHSGIDVAASRGTPIFASRGGYVVRDPSLATNYGPGAVEIYHGGGEYTVYGHPSATFAAPGQYAQRGDVIGAVENTGLVAGQAGGYHLHFELRTGGQPPTPVPAHGDPRLFVAPSNTGQATNPTPFLQPRPSGVGVDRSYVDISPQKGRLQNVVP